MVIQKVYGDGHASCFFFFVGLKQAGEHTGGMMKKQIR